jgi:hypothetical protein
LSDATPRLSAESTALAGSLGTQLLALLWKRNGFYAFESALHVFPAGATGDVMSLDAWNAPGLWRHEFDGGADGLLFFAQDALANQWCLAGDAIYKFDPETGEKERSAATIEDWAARVLTDYPVETAWPLAHEWQAKFGRLREGQRLAPKIPFFLGGEYAIANLYAADQVKFLRYCGDIYRQTRDLPPGTKVKLDIV